MVDHIQKSNKINDFLENRQDALSLKEVEKIVKKLKRHVTR